MQFEKPSLSLEQQLDLLIERGIQCPNRERALHYLRHLNYYRLSAYWRVFESDPTSHCFAPGTQFQDVINLYVFDQELRLLIMDAVEHIEVSVRTGWAYHLSLRYGSHACLRADIFKPSTCWNYELELDNLKNDVNKRHREDFILHLTQKYDESLPPIWATVEIMSLGQISKWYANLDHHSDRQAIADCYDIGEDNFCSLLRHLTTVRNLCAHHSRLWNREFTTTFKLPKHRPADLAASLNPDARHHIYNTLTTLAWLMDCINPHHPWKQRIKRLLGRHSINIRPMGFPDDVADRPLWAAVWKEGA